MVVDDDDDDDESLLPIFLLVHPDVASPPFPPQALSADESDAEQRDG